MTAHHQFATRSARQELLLVLGIMALAVALRLPGLGASFYGDESFSVLRDGNYLLTPTEDRFRPVFFSLLFLWQKLGFHGESGLRALPLLFGVLQVPVAFLVGSLLEGRRGAIAFSLTLAINPPAIEFSQELRMYSMVPLIALVQSWAFVALLTRATRWHRSALWATFVLSGVAGTYTHFHYWFLIVGFAGAVLYARPQLDVRHGLIALTGIVIAYLPNIPNLLRFQREAASAPHLVLGDSIGAIPKMLVAFTLGFNYFVLPDMGITRAIRMTVLTSNIALSALVAVPVTILGWYVVRLHANFKLSPTVWLSHALFSLPALVSLGLSVALGRNFCHPKYLIFAAPFCLLLLVAGYLSIAQRRVQMLVLASTVVAFSVGIVHFWSPREYGRREDWRGAAAYLRQRLSDDSVLLRLGLAAQDSNPSGEIGPRTLWDYYAGDVRNIASVALPSADATAEDLSVALSRAAAGKRRVCYLWSEIARNTDDPGDLILVASRKLFRDEERNQFNPRLAVYCWRVP